MTNQFDKTRLAFVALCLATAVSATLCQAVTATQPSSTPATLPSQSAAPTTQSGPAASKPAVATYPSSDLIASCQKDANTLKTQLDDKFIVNVSAPCVVAGNLPAAEMQKYVVAIDKTEQALWKCYFTKRPDHVITVLLFADQPSYANWAAKLFGDKVPSPFGYYKPDKRTLVMNIAMGGGTLIHELTHALIVYDFPSVPLWFNEGLATLHEQPQISSERLVGKLNWRLPALQQAIAQGKLRPLADMISKNDFYDDKTRGLNYAQSRYLFMYMQDKNLIEKLYKIMRDNHTDTQGDVKLVEQAFGKKINDIEADYIEYVKKLGH